MVAATFLKNVLRFADRSAVCLRIHKCIFHIGHAIWVGVLALARVRSLLSFHAFHCYYDVSGGFWSQFDCVRFNVWRYGLVVNHQ